MNDPYTDKAKAESDILMVKIDELKARLRSSAADVRITIQEKIDALEAKLKVLTGKQ
jgi:hypothetical protein